jgi:hypothetical protein
VLEYIPLAITQAGSYIANRLPLITVTAYLRLFHESESLLTNLLKRYLPGCDHRIPNAGIAPEIRGILILEKAGSYIANRLPLITVTAYLRLFHESESKRTRLLKNEVRLAFMEKSEVGGDGNERKTVGNIGSRLSDCQRKSGEDEKALVQALEYIPLAITQAGSYIANRLPLISSKDICQVVITAYRMLGSRRRSVESSFLRSRVRFPPGVNEYVRSAGNPSGLGARV